MCRGKGEGDCLCDFFDFPPVLALFFSGHGDYTLGFKDTLETNIGLGVYKYNLILNCNKFCLLNIDPL
jgi:hypothetical protein